MNVMTKDCTCAKCVEACRHNPGWMMPDEAARAIDAGLAGKLMRDWLEPCEKVGNEDRIYVLAPASEGCEGCDAPEMDLFSAMLAPALGWTKGRCVLLVDDRCSIHDSGFKPRQCRETYACDRRFGPDNYEVARAWNTPEGRAVVERWEHARW